MTDWLPQAQAELDRITGRHARKKRNTVIALVEARLRGESQASVLGREDTVSRNVFFGKWSKEPTFAEVLENVTKLAQDWRTADDLRRLRERQEAWQRRELELAAKAMDKAELMFDFPLTQVVVEEVPLDRLKVIERPGDDGRAQKMVAVRIITPARWTFDTAGRVATAAGKMGRLALDMNTDKTAEAVDVTAVGMTLEEWRKRAEERRRQAAEVIALFQEAEEDE